MNYKQTFIAISLSALIIGCNKSENTKLANVAGDNITLEDFYQYLQSKPTVNVLVQNQQVSLPVSGTLAFQALEDLINQKLLIQLAIDEGVLPSDQDIEKEIEFKKNLNPRFLSSLTDRGLTIKQIRDGVKLELAQEKILTKGIQIPMTEVEKYITDNKSQFIEPAQVDLYWIYVKDKKSKAKVDLELSGGQSFQYVAEKYNEFPQTEQYKGRFPNRVIKTLPPVIKSLVEKSKVGDKSDWISFSNGFAKFFVDQKIDEKPIVMSPIKKQALQRNLAVQRGKLSKDIGSILLKKFEDSKISVEYEPLQKQWSTFVDQIKKAQNNKNKSSLSSN
jgi:parvulin-like peptidyl-prolyl isomerase